MSKRRVKKKEVIEREESSESKPSEAEAEEDS